MDNKQKLMVWPLDIDTSPIVRYSDMLNNYSIQGVSSFSGWGYGDKDVSNIDGGFKTGVRVSDDFDGLLLECDCVLFSSVCYDMEFETYTLPKVKRAVDVGKEVMLCMPLDEEKIRQVEEIIKDRSKLIYLNNPENNREVSSNIPEELSNINTPVIMVGGLGERCNKFETQLSLRKFFSSMGYRVSQLGTKNYSELFGFHSIPNFMYEEQYTSEQKVYLFNEYLLRIEKEEKPDVIIMGLPGGLMPFDNITVNHFSLLPYIISNAVKPDAMILNLYFDYFTDEFFNEMVNYCKYKFGFETTAFHVANAKYEIDMNNKIEHIRFLSLDSGFVMNNIPVELQDKWKVYNVMSHNSDTMSQFIYDVLAGNVNMMRYA